MIQTKTWEFFFQRRWRKPDIHILEAETSTRSSKVLQMIIKKYGCALYVLRVHVFVLSSVSCDRSPSGAPSFSWCQALVPHLQHVREQKRHVALQTQPWGYSHPWRGSRGDRILRATCQWGPLCVFMCVFGRDLRVFIPLVFVGKKKATGGGFYIVLCERKYDYLLLNIQLL